MTAGLVAGMGLKAAAEAVAARAAEELEKSPGSEMALWTETGATVVLVGYASRQASCAIAIDRSEYDGMAVLEIARRALGGHAD